MTTFLIRLDFGSGFPVLDYKITDTWNRMLEQVERLALRVDPQRVHIFDEATEELFRSFECSRAVKLVVR